MRLRWAICATLLSGYALAAAQATKAPAPLPGEASIRRGELALRKNDTARAESEYRSAAAQALSTMGSLAASVEDWPQALTCFEEASRNLADPGGPLMGVATVYLQQGKYLQAEGVLRELLSDPAMATLRVKQLLASAYAGQNRFDEALQLIAETRSASPHEPELAYAHATIAFRAGKVKIARSAFDDLKKMRSGAAVHVLIGRTLRDNHQYAEAEAELHKALELDPRVRRANYYLGTILLIRDRYERLPEAIADFRRELATIPDDYLSNLNLGIALLADRRPAEALAPLRRAAMASKELEPLYHLGQAQFHTGDVDGAVSSLERYVTRDPREVSIIKNLSNAHYVLAQALRAQGNRSEAEKHFTQAKEMKERLTSSSQERLREYLAGETASQAGAGLVVAEAVPNKDEMASANQALAGITARAYFNLGVILSQRKQYPSAAAVFHRAARWQPDFPNVDYSLGVARFQAGQHQLAIEPLRKAYATTNSPDARRLLALSYFQTESFLKAAELLSTDSAVDSDASLQYTLAVALVRSGQAQRAAGLFGRMLQEHGDSAELHVLLGDAYAQQERFDEALASYEKALQLDTTVANAHLSRGLIFLRRGALDDSERELRSELKNHPKDVRAQFHTAYVLEAKGKAGEATTILWALLKSMPSHPDARYLLGKVLLDRSDINAALEQLEAAVRLSPNEPRYRYQLGLALQKLGRESDAEKQFASFRELKRKEPIQ